MKYGERVNALQHGRLLEVLGYEPDTGVFRWKIKKNSFGGSVGPGVIAGRLDTHGHRIIGIDGHVYGAHRLAWFYQHAKWPLGQIDHKNLVRDDNRIDNLREATRTAQRANQRVRADSGTGIKGVRITRQGRFLARIRKHGAEHHIGVYDTPEEAAAAYAARANEAFGEFARSA